TQRYAESRRELRKSNMRLLVLIILSLAASSFAVAQEKPLPELGRVGVDMNQQRPLSLRDALSMALQNNKDIEVARENVRIAEFDLLGAKGAYDPVFTTSSFYERVESPVSSFLSGGQNGSTIDSGYTGTARLEGESPFLGGNYRFNFSSIRRTTNNQFTALSPQYPTEATFTYTQPLWRELKFNTAAGRSRLRKRTYR